MDLQKHMKKQGLKFTPQRASVFDVLCDNQGKPMTADMIHAACLEKNPHLGLTTVYRTLELFCKSGIAMHVHMHEPAEFYELATDRHHHHMVCVECGQVESFDECMVDEMKEIILDRHDFVITSHCLSVFGYCPTCSAQSDRSRVKDVVGRPEHPEGKPVFSTTGPREVISS